jgi:UDP-glucuronate decarboxylase
MFAGVRSCYDEGKRTAETLAMDYHRGELVNVCFLELFYKFVSIFHSQYLQLCWRPLILPVTCYLHGPEAHSCHFQHAVEGL